jgi:hypothetical protein
VLVCASQELHDRFRAELWRIGNLGDKPRRIWDGAVVRWLKEKSHKATVKGDVAMLRWLDRFLRGKELATINRATIDTITEKKLATGCIRVAGIRGLGVGGDVRRYAHLATDHLAPYAEHLATLRAVESQLHGTKTSHPEN